MTAVTLNVDVGELPDEPAELYALASVVHVACGGHAGDAHSMATAVERCRRHRTLLGAHPSYPDRAGFGRTSMDMDPTQLSTVLAGQLDALWQVAAGQGLAIVSIKPHGALYHDAARSPGVAAAVLAAVERVLPHAAVVGPPHGALMELCLGRARRYVAEGFADRSYTSDGALVPRSSPGALLVDPKRCAAQALELAHSNTVETLCVHGDTPGAVEVLRAVRLELTSHGLLVAT